MSAASPESAAPAAPVGQENPGPNGSATAEARVTPPHGTQRSSSIVDNRGGNTLLLALQEMLPGGSQLDVATAFFSLDALFAVGDALTGCRRARLLFGGDASPTQRNRLLALLRLRSDEDLLAQREQSPTLGALRPLLGLVEDGRLEARCYTREKFHAKAYLVHRGGHPQLAGVLGSGNFTIPGLTRNIELNVELSREQAYHLRDWYEERWKEASTELVTDELYREIRRQVELYEPHLLYAKALKLWGDYVQGSRPEEPDSVLLPLLDPHQYEGFRRAVQISDRYEGVMICDGVGLGKSFIALALMEYFCRGDARGNQDNILLIAPRNVLRSTWEGYLKKYLRRYMSPFGTIHALAMTELGFEPADEEAPPSERDELVQQLFERANVVVVDESHNFRTPSANRYRNLLRIVDWFDGRRKKVVLLTATPVNTQYQDLTAQLALITHEKGSLAGYGIRQIRQYARTLDRNADENSTEDGQLSLELFRTPPDSLNEVLESVVIQRSRQTCRRLAAAAGKDLRFPVRRPPQCIEITLPEQDAGYRELIALADRRFRPGVHLIELMRQEIERVEKAEARRQETHVQSVLDKLQKGSRGLKLAAFLTEQYRRPGSVGAARTYRFEVHLARLVFANALKQLESSPPAFQGIIQSLATGLIARMRLIFGDEGLREVQEHLDWVRTPLFPRPEDDTPSAAGEDAEAEAEGPVAEEEIDEWLDQVVRSRGIARKLGAFDEASFDLERWRRDIVEDLRFLREIHRATLDARKQPDPKLERIAQLAAEATRDGARLLIFTQSRRTAEYLELELSRRLTGKSVARIDSTVAEKRASILHAFCPAYNERPEKWAPTVPPRIDVLISTDVLAEGVNLQEAGAILNYDIHWNPVRLIQRIGRVDRRLDPEKTPHPHAFDIYNVLPPPEIERVIGLVGAVENRTLTISRTVGLDLTFFKPTDPAGNLREFNSDAEKWDALYEGEVTPFDRALEEYVRLTGEDRDLLDRIGDIPDGALGVWESAPRAGIFACYVMAAREEATQEDRRRFKEILGQPVLGIRWQDGSVDLDAPRVLGVLRATVPGDLSGLPSADAALRDALRALRGSVRRQFAEVGGHGLPATIVPRLKCVIELRAEKG